MNTEGLQDITGENENELCGICGKPKRLRRIDGAYILTEISSVLNFNKGILYTIRELLLRPGKSVNLFIHTDRNRLVKPLLFVIVCSLTYTVFQRILRFEDGYADAVGFGQSAVAKIFTWIQQNYGYANILMAFFIAAWIKLFFRKYAYNFFEIIILLCFTMGIGMLLYTVFGSLESLTNIKLLVFGAILGFIYTAWAIGQFFDPNKKMNYLKAFFAYFLGMISFYAFSILLGLAIDIIAKA